MPIATCTFRVFVSSTFEDLKEERNALQRYVFPKLRTLCEQHGTRFQAIDLRWGIRDEAALDQQTMEICLREIRRCQATGVKPNFIVLLGDRYGWRPLPVRIPATEFDTLKPHIPTGEAAAQAIQWYRLDENAVPPEYCLQPRNGEFVEPAAWNPVEESLLEALATAARAARLSEAELVKYEASATHQEILAGLGDSQENTQHVFGFVRGPTGKADPRLDALKSHLRVHEFDAGNLKALCALVLAQLSKVIEAEVKRFEDRPALDLEVEAHDRFAEDRCRIFIGRESVLDTIAEYIVGTERRPLMLHGESGSGKSAVMAIASQRYKGPGRMIRRFIGASPESASGQALLTSLCKQIAPGDTPVDYAQIENAFRERLLTATAERPLVLFIDALDKLFTDDPARDVTWLPPELPPHVKVIFSTTEDVERLPKCLSVRLGRMAQSEAGKALDELLRKAQRTLQPWQRDIVMSHFERCGLALYLKLAAEEGRLWKSYAPEDACTLGEGVVGIIDTLFDRLSSNANYGPVLVERSLGYLAAARYGLTEDEVLDVLAADDAVWYDFDRRKRHAVSERRLPVVVLSRLLLEQEPYLTERMVPGGTVLTFYHTQLADRAAARFLQGDDLQIRHAALARYFGNQPNWLGVGPDSPNARKLTELVRQQLAAGLLQTAETTLTDIHFIASTCAAGLVFDMQDDLGSMLEALPEAHTELHIDAIRDERLMRWSAALANYSASWSTRSRHLEDGQVVAQPEPDFPDIPAATRPWTDARTDSELEHIANAPTIPDCLREILRFLKQDCYALLKFGKRPEFVFQQAFNTFPSGTLHDAAATALSAASSPVILRHWNTRSLRNTSTALLQTLAGHTDEVTYIGISGDGYHATSGSRDNTIRFWNLKTGKCIRVLRAKHMALTALSTSGDGRLAVAVYERESDVLQWATEKDRPIWVWNLETGRCIRIIENQTQISCMCVTPDGRRMLSGGLNSKLQIWDLASEGTSEELNQSGVTTLAITADGRRALAASSMQKTLTIWDLDKKQCIQPLPQDGESVSDLSVTPDGRRAASATLNNTLWIWDLQNFRVLHRIKSRAGGVRLSADGSLAVSSGGWGNAPFNVWDLETGCCLRSLGDGGSTLDITPDARNALSSSTGHALQLWDLEKGQSTSAPKRPSTSVQVMHDGVRALSVIQDNSIDVWNLQSGLVLRRICEQTCRINALGISPDSRIAVSANSDDTLRVWAIDTGTCLRTLAGQGNYVEGVRILKGSNRAVSVSGFRTLRVCDLETGQCLRYLRGHNSKINALSITSDSRRAISASRDKTLIVWDLETGLSVRALSGHLDSVEAVACTANGERAVSASNDTSLKMWDLETGECLFTLRGHSDSITHVILTPDSQHAISASRDNTLCIWDLQTRNCVAQAYTADLCISLDLSAVLNQLIVCSGSGETLQFDLRGLPLRLDENNSLLQSEDEEQRLRREIALCTKVWGPVHENTLLGRAALAKLLQRIGRETDASKIYLDIRNSCQSEEAFSLLIECLEVLLPHIESPGASQRFLSMLMGERESSRSSTFEIHGTENTVTAQRVVEFLDRIQSFKSSDQPSRPASMYAPAIRPAYSVARRDIDHSAAIAATSKRSTSPTTSTLHVVAAALEANDLVRAQDLLSRSVANDKLIRNALAVLRLRQGRVTDALEILRKLLFPDDGIVVDTNAPLTFRINFAVALALSGNEDGLQTALDQMSNQAHPVVQELRAELGRRRDQRPWWRRLVGSTERVPFDLKTPPGEICFGDPHLYTQTGTTE